MEINLQKEVNKILKDEFYPNVVETLQEVIPAVAKESVKKLKQTSPRRPNGGDYAKHWKSMVQEDRMSVGAVIYGDKPTQSLAHLLEHGHALRNGGRAKAIPHIAPVEEWATNEVYNRLLQRLGT